LLAVYVHIMNTIFMAHTIYVGYIEILQHGPYILRMCCPVFTHRFYYRAAGSNTQNEATCCTTKLTPTWVENNFLLSSGVCGIWAHIIEYRGKTLCVHVVYKIAPWRRNLVAETNEILIRKNYRSVLSFYGFVLKKAPYTQFFSH